MAKAKIKWESDVDKAIQSQQRIINKLDETVAKLKEGKTEASNFGGAFEGIASKVAGIVSVTGAVSTLVSALRDFNEVKAQAAEGLVGEEESRKKLIQISGGDPARFNSLVGLADSFVNRGVPRAEALDIVFQSKSLGLTDEAIRRSSRFKTFSTDIKSLDVGSAKIGAAFGPEAVGGTLESRVNAFGAAAFASDLQASTIAENVIVTAASVNRIGGTGEEALAALAVGSKTLSSPEQAATSIRALASLLSTDERTKNAGLFRGARTVLGLDESDPLRARIEAGKRSIVGLNIFAKNDRQLNEVLQSVKDAEAKTGTPESFINQAVGLGESLTSTVAIDTKLAAESMSDATERDAFGAKQLVKEAIIRRAHAELNKTINEAGGILNAPGAAVGSVALDLVGVLNENVGDVADLSASIAAVNPIIGRDEAKRNEFLTLFGGMIQKLGETIDRNGRLHAETAAMLRIKTISVDSPTE